ncbi:2OG-Fe(II) oxygenase [Caenimonas soli]|uniref:2OG-Fe(II) oxygenase n=1 Tax=Caenimonas soli TaxID=2735555 RepID=UPI001556CD57|nr:2OG-Fe(II) oxygenase [Caenimonas soli]NPC58503.1 2OG-Fe(II) oxygenase [Caenimonas soli]
MSSAVLKKPQAIKKPQAKARSRVVTERIEALDWAELSRIVNEEGWAILPGILTPSGADSIAAMFSEEERFRNRIIMERHGFGRGQYKYFDYPLPPLINELRRSFYPHVADIANGWMERLGRETRYPRDHAKYLKELRQAGQDKSTMALLAYGPGDYNALHQDIHGEQVFPLQVIVLLDEPDQDFEGGQLLLSEQRPRMQTRGIVVEPLHKGDAVVITSNNRPVRGSHGDYQVKMRHGVNHLRSGKRHTLGIVFHDAA